MKKLLAMFGIKPKKVANKGNPQFAYYMRLARTMMAIARKDKEAGFHYAVKAAVDSAQHYRKAAHASVYYADFKGHA
jgi:hypothetical protein